MAKTLDRNAFNFQEHAARMGLLDANGNPKVSEEQRLEWERKHKCGTITLTREKDGAKVTVNEGAKDDIAVWAKQGFLPPFVPVADDPKAAIEKLQAENKALNEKLSALIAGLEAKKPESKKPDADAKK